MIQLIKNNFIFLSVFFLISCFGPFKEIKYQIEDSYEESESFIDNPSELKEIKNEVDFKILLSKDFDLISKRNFKIVSANNFVFLAGVDGRIKSFNLDDSTEKEIYNHNEEIISGLSVSDNLLFFIDKSGYLYSINLNGNLEWKSFIGETFTSPVIYKNSIIVRLTNNKFIALNINDGSILWTYQFSKPPLIIKSWADNLISDGVIYAGVSSGKLLALNADNGTLVWETTYSFPRGSSELERTNDTTSPPILDDGVIYVISNYGNIASISKNDGIILWSRSLSSFYGGTLFQDNLFITHNSGSIYSIDKSNGQVVWRNFDLKGRDTSRGFIYNGYLLVSDYEGYIHFFDINSGKIIATYKLFDSLVNEPILNVQNNTLILSSINGSIKIIKTDLLVKNQDNSYKSIDNDSQDQTKKRINENDESLFFDSLIFWE